MADYKTIIKTVCGVCGVTVSRLLSPVRTGPVYFARMLAVRFLEEAGETHEAIGWMLNRTRPSITYTSKAHKREYAQNRIFRKKCEIIRYKLDGADKIQESEEQV